MYPYGDQIIVEQAEPEDSVAIRKLAINSRIDAWSESDYAEEVARDHSLVLKATTDSNLVGFLVSRVVPGRARGSDAELYNVAVSDSLKRKGIGSLLLSDLCRRLEGKGVQNLWLEVRESNSTAISFYEKLGFVAEVTRPNFYSDPVENAVIMRLQIGPKSDIS